MSLDLNSKDFTWVSIKEIQTPRSGKICGYPAWWVTDGENVFFYKGRSPQCNSDKKVIEHIHPGQQYIFIEMSFLNHDCRNYV